MPETADLKIDVGSLAWAGDRRHVADLTDPERVLLEGISRHLEDALPVDDDTGAVVLDAGDDDDDLAGQIVDLEMQVNELEEVVVLAERNLDVALMSTVEDEPKIDVARVVSERLKKERDEGVKDATIPSRANTAQRKAMRLLVEGRVVVKRIDVDGPKAMLVVAEVRGDSGDTYTCGHDPQRRQWRCTCPELRGDCSHIAAVKMVTSIPRGDH